MVIELNAALSDYLSLVSKSFDTGRTDAGLGQRFRLLLSDQQLLLRIVEDLETTKEFTELVMATARDYQNGDAEQGAGGVWAAHVKNYLRLSGLYQLLFSGQKLQPDLVSEQYRASFHVNSHTVTHLAPLEFVEFRGGTVDCGAFAIRRFDRQELDTLLGNAVKKVFYEWACIDSAELDDYWFLCVEDTATANQPGKITCRLDPRVRVRYSPFCFPVLERMGYDTSRRFQEALENLALYDWAGAIDKARQRRRVKRTPENPALYDSAGAIKDQPGDYEKWPKEWHGPFLPRVPFVISSSDSLIDWPARSADLSALEKDPVQDPTTGDYFYVPRRNLTLSEDETRAFESSMQRLACLRVKLQQHSEPWRFAQTALGFLLKGFTTEGIEQLLWHITAIDAALGDKQRGGSKRLADRASKIFGPQKDRDEHRQQFEQLYSYRCDLVHGNVELADKTVTRSHLSEARDFARGAVLWTLRYLNHVAENLPIGSQAVPSREELVQVLDMDSGSRHRLPNIPAGLPADFPYVEGWLKCE